jgi:putative DNA primase/helicase
VSQWNEKTIIAAKGKWKGILLQLGLPDTALVNRHGPCPMCDGIDRFRWDNKEGQGTFICSQCGAGSGMDLAIKYTGRSFAEVAAEIDAILGNNKIEPDRVKPDMTEAQRQAALRELAKQTTRVGPGDLVDKYLTARGVGQGIYPKVLRFAANIRDGEGALRPAMVATVQAPDGENTTLHRTFLRPDGMAKAEMASPRKLMPGTLPEGSAIRLSDYEGGPLGIAEGIETALSATELFDMPVWAAIHARNLSRWAPPAPCEEVAIFADNDPKFAGHAAAWVLAHKLACKGIEVTVHLPETAGDDWNDILLKSCRSA